MTTTIASANSLYSIPVKDIDGKDTSLKPYAGKVLLVVNTASRCGYTPQYEGLQKLHTKMADQGLVVLGFPSNDFGGQEPGSNEEIKKFCALNFKVNFPMFAKGPVKGESKQPLFQELLKLSESKDEIKWNFEKFLISKSGKVVARFSSRVAPDSPELVGAIEKELKAKP